MPDDEGSPRARSDTDSFLRAIAAAPSAPIKGVAEVDPERVAHFRILGRLGAGGMGIVYRAHDEQLRREVAVKLLPQVHSSDPERRQRFLREARSAAALVHPNVAVVYQVGEADGRIYIAMELVEGTTLRHKLEAGALTASAARSLASQMAQGLAAAHAKGIVHRDLKPENVMVTSAGAVKLLDFGLAKSGWGTDSGSELERADTEAQITREGAVLGSSAYMSPEQALGLAVDARSDVFAFGIVLYEMLSGTRPFHGATLGEVRAAIAREAPVPLDQRARAVDAGLADVVKRCLAKKAEDRYASAADIAEALAAVAPSSGSQPGAPSKGELPSVATPRSGRSTAVIGIAALAVVATIGGARFLGSRSVTTAPIGSALASTTAVFSEASAGLAYDDGGNPSKNPEAQRAYEQALAEFHGGTGQARKWLKKAIELDPTFGAAHLRLLVTKEYDYLIRYKATVENEATLSDRDRALLSVMQGGFSPPNDQIVAAKKALDDMLVAHPHDEYVRHTRMTFSANDGEAAMCAYRSRAVAEMPSFLTDVARYARECLTQGRRVSPEAFAAVDGCLAASPRATDCLAVRVELDELNDDCVRLDADARKLVALDPESREGHDGLANALAAQGASPDGVREALGTAEDRGWTLHAADPAMLAGDFVQAERIAEAAFRATVAAKDGDHMQAPASVLIEAYTESGDAAGAARVGEDLLDHLRPTCDWCFTSEAQGILAMARGGRMTRARADQQLHERYLKYARVFDHFKAWTGIYGALVRSREDAESALRVYEGEVGASDLASVSWSLPFTYMYAGRTADARPLFAKVGSVCRMATDTRGVLVEHLMRGQLDEDAGDKVSACKHYATILDRWGHAKPRSITADEARAHAAKLGCGS